MHLVLAFLVATFLLSLAPGPDLLFVIANGVSGGRRAGFTAALGMSSGLAMHTTAAALGLGFLLRSAPEALVVVRLAGAAVLVYLAVTTWMSSRRHEDPKITAPRSRSLRRTYLMAMLTNVSNPKVILFYLAFVPQFLTLGQHAWPVTAQLLTLGLMFIVVGLSVDGSAGLVSGSLSESLSTRPGVRRWLERMSAAVFAGLASRLILDS